MFVLLLIMWDMMALTAKHKKNRQLQNTSSICVWYLSVASPTKQYIVCITSS